MREYGGDIRFICLEAQTLAKKQSSFKVFLICQWHCLATIAFILDFYLWWLKHVYCDGSITIRLCGALAFDFTLPCRWVKKQFWQIITGQQIFGLVFFILISWCFLMFFCALSPKMTLVFRSVSRFSVIWKFLNFGNDVIFLGCNML